MKKFCLLSVWILLLGLFAGCKSEPPFSLRFNGVLGEYESGELVAEMLLSEGEMGAGRVNLIAHPEENITFLYTISEKGEISFSFDTEDSVGGTLKGKKIEIKATILGQAHEFSGTLYHLVETVDGEVAEEGYLTPGYPLSEIIAQEEGETILLNGEPITLEELKTMKMPGRDLSFEIKTEES